MIDLSPFEGLSRLLVEADLRPAQGTRFQPTGFPDLGAATFRRGPSRFVLVESAQSMANRMETACWDEAASDLVGPLQGLPYVRVEVSDGAKRATTSSVLEAHRLNSPYVLKGKLEDGRTFGDLFVEKSGYQENWPLEPLRTAGAILSHDPSSLLHGLFMSNLPGGRLRIQRALGSFIEAEGVEMATSGGVKNDRVNPGGDTGEGFGNVPFSRTEFTAERIVAYFNLDLRQIRGYGLSREATDLLVLLALFKVRRVLEHGLRLRTACDFTVERVGGAAAALLPPLDALAAALPGAISAASAAFASPAVTRLRFEATKESKQGSKKSRKEKAAGEKGAGEKDGDEASGS